MLPTVKIMTSRILSSLRYLYNIKAFIKFSNSYYSVDPSMTISSNNFLDFCIGNIKKLFNSSYRLKFTLFICICYKNLLSIF